MNLVTAVVSSIRYLCPFFWNLATSSCRVTESFRKLVAWRKFKQHVTQVRRVVTDYEPTSSEVLIYDFLMPLTNEAYLRTTLDSLFFKDAILARLKTIPSADLEKHFNRQMGQSDEAFLEVMINFIEEHFIGYSISHVDGRYRSGRVLTQPTRVRNLKGSAF